MFQISIVIVILATYIDERINPWGNINYALNENINKY